MGWLTVADLTVEEFKALIKEIFIQTVCEMG